MIHLCRPRRLRSNPSIRALFREHSISTDDFIVPLFVVEGHNLRESIPSMPGQSRLSIDNLKEEIKTLWDLGLKCVLLFAKIPDNLKDNEGEEALNPNGLMPRAVRAVKQVAPDMVVMTDVALDPYSSFGHDGIVIDQKIDNDKTVEILSQISLMHARAGVDFVTPSDMMDARVGAIRAVLEDADYIDVGIISYTAKYASALYGPFRDALDSAPGFGDKKTYQMDVSNRKEALKEAKLDIEEGADILMVKPALSYLDIISDISGHTDLPVAAYQVSGEYAMIKIAAEKGLIDHDAVMLEQLISIKRAGASLIASYFAKEVALLLQK